jgi:repressor LexA
MTFDELLAKWNRGILRGAPRRFARAVGVQEAAVSTWRRGRTPAEELRPKIAKELGVGVSELVALFERTSPMMVRESGPAFGLSETSPVPVVGVVAADSFDFDFNHAPDEYLPIPRVGRQKTAALKVSGACMEPTVRDGDYVIVAEAEYVPDGKLGVFRLDGGCTLKRPFRKGDVVELRPDNPKFKTLRVPAAKLEVVGVVVGFFRKP